MSDHVNSKKIPAPRTPLSLRVQFKKNYARTAAKAELKNISISGAFIEGYSVELKIEDKLSLTFVVAGRERKVSAKVIWSNSNGSGIKFLPANNRDVQIIDDLIYYVENQRDGRRGVLDQILNKVAA
ncbi:MAG: PilZ domain-containing protein [Pseudobdellovibrionaceae bacterium]